MVTPWPTSTSSICQKKRQRTGASSGVSSTTRSKRSPVSPTWTAAAYSGVPDRSVVSARPRRRRSSRRPGKPAAKVHTGGVAGMSTSPRSVDTTSIEPSMVARPPGRPRLPASTRPTTAPEIRPLRSTGAATTKLRLPGSSASTTGRLVRRSRWNQRSLARLRGGGPARGLAHRGDPGAGEEGRRREEGRVVVGEVEELALGLEVLVQEVDLRAGGEPLQLVLQRAEMNREGLGVHRCLAGHA